MLDSCIDNNHNFLQIDNDNTCLILITMFGVFLPYFDNHNLYFYGGGV